MAGADDVLRDPNRFAWPVERSDVAALGNGLIAVGCLVFGKSDWIVGVALLLATFAVLSPRMRRGRVSGPGFSFSGEFVTRGYASNDTPPQFHGVKQDAGAPTTPVPESDPPPHSEPQPSPHLPPPDTRPGSG